MNKKINLVLVDDHYLVKEGIKFVLSQIETVNIVAEALNGEEFLELLKTIDLPDIVLMDINMPKMDGIEACKIATKKYPDIKIIHLTMNEEQEYYFKAIQAGARGFILKQSGVQDLTKSINEVMNGGSYFPEEIMRKIIFKLGSEDSIENKIMNAFGLSKREKEVLALLCQGYTNNEIAEKLFVSAKTIEGHRANLLSKTNTKNSAHLVMFAIKKGIIQI